MTATQLKTAADNLESKGSLRQPLAPGLEEVESTTTPGTMSHETLVAMDKACGEPATLIELPEEAMRRAKGEYTTEEDREFMSRVAARMGYKAFYGAEAVEHMMTGEKVGYRRALRDVLGDVEKTMIQIKQVSGGYINVCPALGPTGLTAKIKARLENKNE